MRAIKFRAWDSVNNKWLLGYEYKNLGGFSMFGEVMAFGEYQNMLSNFQIQDWYKIKLMQFTGLTDKNGKEIYEGDIVTYKRSIGNWTGQYMTTTHKIVFSEEVFAFVMEYGSSYIKLRKHWGYEYEVIGNIYENPELLKKE
jgi:uncharacterized phage protein (TIGR01671 family)